MRAFIAIDLPEDARAALAKFQDQLKPCGADVAWVKPDNIHLTLKFLGDITDEQKDAMAAELARIAAQTPAFTMELGEVGVFPSPAAPRVVWVGLKQGTEEATALAGQLEQAAHKLGLKAEDRAYSAHVTLGRVRTPRSRTPLMKGLERASWQPCPAWSVNHVTLYQSHLLAQGARYTQLISATLK